MFNLFLDVVQFVSSNVRSKSELPYLIVLLNQIKRFVFLFFPWSELRVVAGKKKGRPGSAPTGSRVKSQSVSKRILLRFSLSSLRSTGKQLLWVGAGRGGRLRLGWFSWQCKMLLYLGNKWETSVPWAAKLLSFTSPTLHTWQFFRKETPKPFWLWSLQTKIKIIHSCSSFEAHNE